MQLIHRVTDRCRRLREALQASYFDGGEIIGRHFLWLAILFSVLVYLPFVGLTFHSDDFFRILDNFDVSWEGVARSFTTTKSDGFYRPLNHLTFFLNYIVAGTDPGFYGFFNFLLYAFNLVLAYNVLSRFTGNSLLSGLAVCCWVLNYRSSEMLLLWIVGRTELLYVFFCLLSISSLLQTEVTRKGIALSWIFFACALLSKETSVVFAPLLCLAVLSFPAPSGARKGVAVSGICIISLSYLYVRYFAHGMLPAAAPDYYRFRYDLGFVLGNYASYFFRSSGLALLIIAAVYLSGGKFDLRVRLYAQRKEMLTFLCLFAALLLPIIFIPSRSNLYYYLASLCLSASFLSLVDYKKIDVSLLFKRVVVIMALMSLLVTRYNTIHLLGRNHIYSLSKVVGSKKDMKTLQLSEAEKNYLSAALEIRRRERNQ